jgi:methyltransferase (TIGR00027 family)
MQQGQPSRTARVAAAHRAAHQVLEQGRIFADPLAVRILGEDTEALVHDALQHPHKRAMRLFIAVRTRFAEDALTVAAAHGVRQLVVLGAGLDTYAYRNALGDRLRIFEVDHPATQAWKRERLAAAAIPLPPCAHLCSGGFRVRDLGERLSRRRLRFGATILLHLARRRPLSD